MAPRFTLTAGLCALMLCATGPALAVEPPPPPDIIPQDAQSAQFTLVQVLTESEVQKIWFTDQFLKAVPLPAIQAKLNETRAVLGTFISLRLSGDHYEARFTKGRAKVKMFMVGPQIDNLEIYDAVTKATDDGAYRLSQIFQANPIPDVFFSRDFLVQFPITSVQSSVAAMKRQYGAYRAISITGDETYLVQFERGATVAKVHLDENEKVDGMSFQSPADFAPAKS